MEDNNRDAADQDARKRSVQGLPRNVQVQRTNNRVDPSRGGSTGYRLTRRQQALADAALYGVPYAARCHKISANSIYRWMERALPYRQTGGRERESLVGDDQFHLAVSLFLFPRASADDHCAFIASRGGGVYTRQAFYKRCKELKVKRKKTSLQASAAYTDTNRLRFRLFWNSPPPLGITGVDRYSLCDTDEAGFTLTQVESKYGYGYKAVRVRDIAHYSRTSDDYISLIMTVEPGNPDLPGDVYGSVQNPRKWWKIIRCHCNQDIFSDYIDYVCSDIEDNPLPDGHDEVKFFMWDNLSVHRTDQVMATVENRASRQDHRFNVLFRPPYRPDVAPIEYIFGEINNILAQEVRQEWTVETLALAIHNACTQVGGNGSINRTFEHCGY